MTTRAIPIERRPASDRPAEPIAIDGQRPGWRHPHLLDCDTLSVSDMEWLMDEAERMSSVLRDRAPKPASLRGVRVTNLFYEASTRTRVAFEVAAKNLGADVVNVSASGSSVTKGESLVDTIRTLEALGTRILVLRHARSGAPYLAARHFGGHVVNAGDGRHAHPTQALLDLFTMRRHLPGGRVQGAKVAIVGDVLHSRVARSNLWTLTAFGADVWLCGPATLVSGFEAWARALPPERRVTVTTDLSAALRDADAVMALRLQKERQDAGLLPSLAEYRSRYGITAERLREARQGALVLHPGPMNEGVEIDADVAAGAQSLITEQVANGVAVRMALLEALVSTSTHEPTAATTLPR